MDTISFYLIVEQMLGYEFEGVAGYSENEQETRCQQEKKERHSFGECRSKYVFLM